MVNLYRSELLENRLRDLTQTVTNIRETVIVSSDGFVVAAYPVPDSDNGTVNRTATSTPQVAAMAAALLSLGDQTLERLAQGHMQRLMIQGEDGAIIVYPINRNAALCALVDSNSKMGLMLREISRTAAGLISYLPG